MIPSALGAAGGGAIGLGIGTGTVSRTLQSNKPLIRDIAKAYNAYKRGELTKGQYDYRRAKSIEELKSRLGPTRRILFGSRRAGEVLRIDRGGSMPTGTLLRNIDRMARIGKFASHGAIVLSAANLGLSCVQIAETPDRHKKNDILVESLGNLTGGGVYGLGVALILESTPVGWVAAFVIAAGGAVFSSIFSDSMVAGYNTMTPNLDIVHVTHLDQVCH